MSKLIRYEQETIINFNAGEKMATVYTADPAFIRNLDSLVIEYPDTFKCIKVNDISKTYEMPKTSVTYRKPRRLSGEQREAAKQRMKKIMVDNCIANVPHKRYTLFWRIGKWTEIIKHIQ